MSGVIELKAWFSCVWYCSLWLSFIAEMLELLELLKLKLKFTRDVARVVPTSWGYST